MDENNPPGHVYEDWIDPQKWKDLEDSLGEALVDIVESYLEDSQEYILKIDKAFQQEDQDGLQNAVHSLKSSSGIFGIRRLVELCNQMENENLGDQETLSNQIASIHSIYTMASLALKEKLIKYSRQTRDNQPG